MVLLHDECISTPTYNTYNLCSISVAKIGEREGLRGLNSAACVLIDLHNATLSRELKRPDEEFGLPSVGYLFVVWVLQAFKHFEDTQKEFCGVLFSRFVPHLRPGGFKAAWKQVRE